MTIRLWQQYDFVQLQDVQDSYVSNLERMGG